MAESTSEIVCPTCGPTTLEPHPRRSALSRCPNCKEWLGNDRPMTEKAE